MVEYCYNLTCPDCFFHFHCSVLTKKNGNVFHCQHFTLYDIKFSYVHAVIEFVQLGDSVDSDGSVIVTNNILINTSYYVGYEAQYCGKQCLAKKEHPKNDISKTLLKRECQFLASFKHPCVIQLLTIPDDPEIPVLLVERMWMSLTEFLTNRRSHHDKVKILHDVACGLHYIHSEGVIHCDLTSDNILLTENITAKLANFGRATYCQQKINYLPENFNNMPPELFEPYSTVGCSSKVDVFSFGCVMIHTFTQEPPIPDCDKYVEICNIGVYKKYSEVERRSVCLKKLKTTINAMKLHDHVLGCLQDDPDCRPTAATLLSVLERYLAKCITMSFQLDVLIIVLK